MIVTLMMVTFNRLNFTKQTIECLQTQTIEFNLIIVDNFSQDGTIEYLKNLEKNYKPDNLLSLNIIYNNENKGIAIGRNQALKKADELNTDFYCCLDNDVIIAPNAIEQCIKIIKTIPQYGCVGVNLENISYPLVKFGDLTFENKPQGNLGSACMVFSKAVHKMIGFFNTNYNKYGLEDSDAGFRMRVAGFKLGYLTEHGIHLGGNEDPNDEYRKWKTQQHDSLVKEFQKNCGLYVNKLKPIYIPYKD